MMDIQWREQLIKLKDILNEDEVDDAFGDDIITKLDDPSIHLDMEYELRTALGRWVDSTNSQDAKFLFDNRGLLEKMREKFPKIFGPRHKNGTPIYRGVKLSAINSYNSSKLIKLLQSSSGRKEFVEYKNSLFITKKPIKYTPHNFAQSWTYSLSVAKKFSYRQRPSLGYSDGTRAGIAILVTKQNDNFFFNTKTLQALGVEHLKEDEIIHIGKDYIEPVYLITEKFW